MRISIVLIKMSVFLKKKQKRITLRTAGNFHEKSLRQITLNLEERAEKKLPQSESSGPAHR